MKQIKSSEMAISTIIDSSIKHAHATTKGDYKTANKNYYLIKGSVDYLQQNNGIERLIELLKNPEVSVRSWVASFLLSHATTQAVAVLEEIAAQSIPHQSFAARIILEEWRKKQ